MSGARHARRANDCEAFDKEIMEDAVAYLRETADRYDRVVVVICDASTSVQEHAVTTTDLRKLPQVEEVIVFSRPGQLLRVLGEQEVLRQGDDGSVLGYLAAVGLPTPLRQVLDARLARLGAEHLHLLTLAAVIGQEVPLNLRAAVAELAEDGLLDAIDVDVSELSRRLVGLGALW